MTFTQKLRECIYGYHFVYLLPSERIDSTDYYIELENNSIIKIGSMICNKIVMTEGNHTIIGVNPVAGKMSALDMICSVKYEGIKIKKVMRSIANDIH